MLGASDCGFARREFYSQLGTVHSVFHEFGIDDIGTKLAWKLNTDRLTLGWLPGRNIWYIAPQGFRSSKRGVGTIGADLPRILMSQSLYYIIIHILLVQSGTYSFVTNFKKISRLLLLGVFYDFLLKHNLTYYNCLMGSHPETKWRYLVHQRILSFFRCKTGFWEYHFFIGVLVYCMLFFRF